MSTGSRVERQNLRDVVANVVRDRILDGEFGPGDRIDQDLLAAELGYSKLPVREALIRLELMGLVRMRPYGGCFVVELSPDDLRDTYAVYGAACGMAAGQAASVLSDGELDRLDGVLDEIDRRPGGREIDVAHMEFHRTINRAGASRRLRWIIGQLYGSLPVRTFDFTHLWLDGAQHDHRRILTDLRHRDRDAAEASTREHFVSGGERVVDALNERGYWDARDDL